MADFFKAEDVEAAKKALTDWMAQFPEASVALKALWKANYMKAGHKNLARELVK